MNIKPHQQRLKKETPWRCWAERVMWQISWSQNPVCLIQLCIIKHAYWWCEPRATWQHPFGRYFKTTASINVGFVPASGAENHSRTLICPYFLFAFLTAGLGFYRVWWSSVGLHVNSLTSKTKQRGSSGKPEEIAVYSEEKQVHVSYIHLWMVSRLHCASCYCRV